MVGLIYKLLSFAIRVILLAVTIGIILVNPKR